MPVDIVTTLYGRQERSWQLQANCMGVDPDLFFPERGASTREAKEVCRGCVVREDCLEYALANGEKFGIWGGMSERERRRLRRARALARRDVGQRLLATATALPILGAGTPPSLSDRPSSARLPAGTVARTDLGDEPDQLAALDPAPRLAHERGHRVVEPVRARSGPGRPGCTRPGPAPRRPGPSARTSGPRTSGATRRATSTEETQTL